MGYSEGIQTLINRILEDMTASKEHIMDLALRGTMERELKWFPLEKLKVREDLENLQKMSWCNRKTKREMRRLKKKLVSLNNFFPLRKSNDLFTVFHSKHKTAWGGPHSYYAAIQLQNLGREDITALIWTFSKYSVPRSSTIRCFDYLFQESRKQATLAISSEYYPQILTLMFLLDQDMIIQEEPIIITRL